MACPSILAWQGSSQIQRQEGTEERAIQGKLGEVPVE